MKSVLFAAVGIGMQALFATEGDRHPAVVGFFTRDAAGQDLVLTGARAEQQGEEGVTFDLSRGRGLFEDKFGGDNWPQEPETREHVGQAIVRVNANRALDVEFVDLDLAELVPSPSPPTPPRVNRGIRFNPLTD